MTFEELCAAAQQGDRDAQFELGGFWWERNNYERAVEWYTLSAEQGNVDAQYSLGAYYHNMHQNEKSFYWHEQAALQGDAEAQNIIGEYYLDGTGVKQDVIIKGEEFKLIQ